MCVLCNDAKEEISHLFFECRFSAKVWERVLKKIKVHRRPFKWARDISWFQRKTCGKSMLTRVRRVALSTCVYMIWKARNCLIFQQKQPQGVQRNPRGASDAL
ncbi:Reverse transcriptase zinc-binding domain-containing protein [Dioscorea alata]|uniref:Reverse transcriptase zinc-binding domain-containing protein n=1 Tax=Dioscorea alata TaxID=55571 RepID=A0ACB7UZ30_DIOAL|nr:Reverse transcriptase zinc-binding domain-containing protein [Dioscorea alata]